MTNKPNLDDYVDVRERMAEFFEKYPEGSFQSECQFSTVDDRWWVVVKAYAYRTPDDVKPGVGLAWEVVPGKTPYTRDSELQNAETAAWGRAVIAVGAGDSKKPIASREEVRNRTADSEVVSNSEGRAELGKLCEEFNFPPEGIKELYIQKYGHKPLVAPNEEIKAFVNLVRTGVIKIAVDGEH